MSRSVVIVASGVNSAGAIGGRVGALAAGLRASDWTVEVIDLTPRRQSRTRALMDRLPPPVSRLAEEAGFEGDVCPSISRRAKNTAAQISASVAVVSVPPFSLLPAVARGLPASIPLVIDYRDPWSGRRRPSPLARLTRPIEEHCLRTATAVTYAGGPELGELLASKLKVAPHRVIAVPNGYDPADLTGVPPHQPQPDRNGTPLDLVFGGFWYGRNGPGILPRALALTGPNVATLTIIGGVSQPIAGRFERLTGSPPRLDESRSRAELYQRLAHADASVIPLDHASATESRIPAKMYDCLAVGTPVIAICPPGSALLSAPGAERFHHIHHRDVGTLADLLRRACLDRSSLRSGPPACGVTRQQAAATMDRLLRAIAGTSESANAEDGTGGQDISAGSSATGPLTLSRPISRIRRRGRH